MEPNGQRPLVGSVKAQKTVIANVAHVYELTVWGPSQRDAAVEIVKELEDRRVLFSDYELEVPQYVVDSVRQIREVLHQKLITVREEGKRPDLPSGLTSVLRTTMSSWLMDWKWGLVAAHAGSERFLISGGLRN